MIQKALNEVARIICPDALFIFITVEIKKPQLVNDFRPLLHKAGFEVKLYKETEDYNREVWKKMIENKKQLIKDMGYQGAILWIMAAKELLSRLKNQRRVLAVARKIQ